MIIIETDRTQAHTHTETKPNMLMPFGFDAISSMRHEDTHQTIRCLQKIMFSFLSRTLLSFRTHTHSLKSTSSSFSPFSHLVLSALPSLFITFCFTRAHGFQFRRQTHAHSKRVRVKVRERDRVSLSSFSCHSNELLCLFWMCLRLQLAMANFPYGYLFTKIFRLVPVGSMCCSMEAFSALLHSIVECVCLYMNSFICLCEHACVRACVYVYKCVCVLETWT